MRGPVRYHNHYLVSSIIKNKPKTQNGISLVWLKSFMSIFELITMARKMECSNHPCLDLCP